ncbi:MAG: thermonuclease family protein [Granulosicoccus sp.]
MSKRQGSAFAGPSAFLIFTCLLLSAPLLARECQSGLTQTNAVASRVVDGDTLVLNTQQRVRIIGLNTLEMNAGSPQDRYWASQATKTLNDLVTGKPVTLLAGRDRKDRYGRLLAHVRLPDGVDVAQELIRQGLAIAVGVGKNTACSESNRVLENQARSQRLGIWKNKGGWWKDSEEKLNARRGFYLIRSSIVTRTRQGTNTRLKMANGLQVKLGAGWPLDALQTDTLLAGTVNQLVEVRGWISGHLSAPEISLHHPANLRIVAR